MGIFDLFKKASTSEEVEYEWMYGHKVPKIIRPHGVTFKFLIKPGIIKKRQPDHEYEIKNESFLSQYFNPKTIKVTHKPSKGGWQEVIIYCPEATIEVNKKSQEEEFYKQVKDLFTGVMIKVMKKNGHDVKLSEFIIHTN